MSARLAAAFTTCQMAFGVIPSPQILSSRLTRRKIVPPLMPAADEWITAAGINGGKSFRRVSRLDKSWGDGITPKAIWHVVRAAAKRADIKNLAPHDLRRTCARLCHLAGGELEQIQFLLGHASVQTTERYLGCKQKLGQAVNDNLGLEVT